MMNKEKLYLILLIISICISLVMLFAGMFDDSARRVDDMFITHKCTQIILPDDKIFYCCGDYHFNADGEWNGHCDREYEVEVD